MKYTGIMHLGQYSEINILDTTCRLGVTFGLSGNQTYKQKYEINFAVRIRLKLEDLVNYKYP